jgi:hypothetical protein
MRKKTAAEVASRPSRQAKIIARSATTTISDAPRLAVSQKAAIHPGSRTALAIHQKLAAVWLRDVTRSA